MSKPKPLRKWLEMLCWLALALYAGYGLNEPALAIVSGFVAGQTSLELAVATAPVLDRWIERRL